MTTIKSKQRGLSSVLLLLSLVPLIGFAALAIDSGLIYAARGALQTAADAGALSGVRALQGCNSSAADRAAALAAAQTSVTANPVIGRVLALGAGDVAFGRATGTSRTFSSTNANPDSVQVVVHEDAAGNGPLPLTLGAVLGRSAANLDAWSVATRDRRVIGFKIPGGSTGRVLPFAASSGAFGAIGSAASLFDGSTGPGNLGLIDLTASGFTTSAHSSDPTVVSQITNGFQGTLALGSNGTALTSGRTGSLGGSIGSALQGRVGDVIIVATYGSAPTGNGTNLTYTITGFAALRVSSVKVTGALASRGIFGTVAAIADDTAITDPSAAENCFVSRIQLTR